MAVIKEDIVNIDMENGTASRSFANRLLGEGDTAGNRYGFRCIKNGNPVSLAGLNCVGYFTRSDGYTVIIEGTIDGTVAYVTLPEACCAVQGTFSLAIKLTSASESVTIRVIDGTVMDLIPEGIVDPGNVIPSIDDLLAVIGQAEAAVAAIDQFSISVQLISGTRYKVIVNKTEEA